MAIIKAKNGVMLLAIGIGLLVTLSACENSKHAEIMSSEDLLAQAQTATSPETDTQTESDQAGGTFEGQSIDQTLLGLTEPIVPDPELPPSPASPAINEDVSKSGPEVALSAPAPILPEGYAEAPLVERSPASDYVPDSPPQVFHEARVREFGVSSLAEPEMEIAKIEPSDFVPEAQEPTIEPSDFAPEAPEPTLKANRVETGVDSELADIFFEFDQYAIRAAAVPVLEKNAELLKQTYKNSSVLIEGHCDERGTGEYNLDLGKRRAQAVKDYLIDLGIEESRIQIASYGKEKPFCTESAPSCWQQNRRGHFVQRVLHTSLSSK